MPVFDDLQKEKTMNEIVAVPLIQIIMFLAALYAPSNTAEIEIDHPDGVHAYVQDSGMWVSKNDPDDAYVIRGTKMLSSSGVIDLETELDGISGHDWAEESILKLGSGIEVLKTKKGLLIYPDGIRGSDEPIRVSYRVVERPARRLVH
jgi:hypothetical protein